MDKFDEIKTKANNHFNQQEYEAALACYSDALKACQTDDQKLIVYKNMAVTHLKLEEYEEALNYCNLALKLSPGDVKTLFRRSKINEQLGNISEAFKDILKAHAVDKTDKNIEKQLSALRVKVENLKNEMNSVSNKVEKILDLLKQEATTKEQLDNQIQACKGLISLSNEATFCDSLEKLGGFNVIKSKLETHKPDQINLLLLRLLSEVSKQQNFTIDILQRFKFEFFVNLFGYYEDEESLSTLQYFIQKLINNLSGVQKKGEFVIDKDLIKKNEAELNDIMTSLFERTDTRAISPQARDAVLQLCAKNVDANALNWGEKVVKENLLTNILDIAAEIEDAKYESSMRISRNTKVHVSLILERVFNCCYYDKARAEYMNIVEMYIKSLLTSPDLESKIRAVLVITCLLNGPIEVGNQCLAKQGIVEMMLAMASSDDELQQKIAAEALIAATTKKDKCTSIISMGKDILKKLYMSDKDEIKVRALVGLCKMSSSGGTDASIRPFDEEVTKKLLAACKKFILKKQTDLYSDSDADLKRWAAEGIAFLTLDADVKEDVCHDEQIIRALVELAKTGDMNVVYGTVTTFVNLTNSYDKQEILPEMLELAKFAKQHVPEEHVKDKPEYVEKRCALLAKMNIVTALVSLVKTESKTSREMISRVMNALCEFQQLRGKIVQDGGARVLIQLATQNNTPKGLEHARQAVARIAITINPADAFPGQRAAEIVRPLLHLLDINLNALQNFEGLMALTNLAQIDNTIQSQILKDDGFSRIEHYIYENHEMLKRASVECLANLIRHKEVIKKFEAENDRLKYFVALCQCDDLQTALAAAGGLAMITNVSKKCCEKVFESKVWTEVLIMLCSNENLEFQHRGVFLVYNLVYASKELAERIAETQVLDVIMALCRPEVDNVPPQVKELCSNIIDQMQTYGLVKKND